MKQVLALIAIVGLLFSCAGPSTDPVPNNQIAESGDPLWRASYMNAALQMSEQFKFKGTQDKSDQRVGRKYYVYDAGQGHFLYIVEIRVKGTWTFPDDYDPLLGRDQNPKDPNLLEYSPRTYSVWTGMRERSYRVVTGLGVEVPKCKIMVQQAKISPSRKGGVWVVMSYPSTCDRTNLEIDDALNFHAEFLDFK